MEYVKFNGRVFSVSEADDKIIKAFPRGGGFEYNLPRELCTPCSAPEIHMISGYVYFDAAGEENKEERFLCRLDPEDRWNGWAQPVFTPEQMQKVLDNMQYSIGGPASNYDHINQDPDRSMTIHTLIPKHLYEGWEEQEMTVNISRDGSELSIDGLTWTHALPEELCAYEVCRLDATWKSWPGHSANEESDTLCGTDWRLVDRILDRYEAEPLVACWCYAHEAYPGVVLMEDDDMRGSFDVVNEIKTAAGDSLTLLYGQDLQLSAALAQVAELPLLQKCYVNGHAADAAMGSPMKESAYQVVDALAASGWCASSTEERTLIHPEIPGVGLLQRGDGRIEVAALYQGLSERGEEIKVLLCYGTYASLDEAAVVAARVKPPVLHFSLVENMENVLSADPLYLQQEHSL